MSEPIPDFDLYELLEVSPAASTPTIEAAWRSLMKRSHPDLRGSDAEEHARRLNVAHDWLTDSDRRAHYDRARAAAPGRAQAPRPSAGRSTAAERSPATLPQLVFLLGLALVPIGGLGGWTDLLILGGILAATCALILVAGRR